jgi:hypothetical protein
MAYATQFQHLGHLPNGQGPNSFDNVFRIRESTRCNTEELEMKKTLLALAILMAGGMAHAKKSCTDQPQDKWMKEEDFRKRVEGEGYKIRKFKQPGSCYEIYGVNKEGKDVEVYFNPVDGTVVKEKVK